MRRVRQATGVRPNDGVTARKQDPSIFNAAGNPYIGGYLVLGKPFFGYWMGVLIVIAVVVSAAIGVRYVISAGVNLALRSNTARNAMHKMLVTWSHMLETNWTTCDEPDMHEQCILRVGAWLQSHFAPGPFEVEASDIFLRHAEGSGTTVDPEILRNDAEQLYNLLRHEWLTNTEWVWVASKARVKPYFEFDMLSEQMDGIGRFIQGAATVEVRAWPRGQPSERHSWTFVVRCNWRATGPNPERYPTSWSCFDAEMAHHWEKIRK